MTFIMSKGDINHLNHWLTSPKLRYNSINMAVSLHKKHKLKLRKMKTILMSRTEAAKYNLQHVIQEDCKEYLSFLRELITMDEDEFLKICTLPLQQLRRNLYYIVTAWKRYSILILISLSFRNLTIVGCCFSTNSLIKESRLIFIL